MSVTVVLCKERLSGHRFKEGQVRGLSLPTQRTKDHVDESNQTGGYVCREGMGAAKRLDLMKYSRVADLGGYD